MTPSEILYAAEEARPDLLEKVATAIYVLEQTAPDFAADLLLEIEEIATNTQEKTAALSPLSLGLSAGAALGVGLAGAVATDLYDAAKRGLTRGRNFNRMMATNPDLKHFDKEDLKRSFDTVHRFAPEMTADPMVSAQLVRGLAVTPENSAGTVKELLIARKALADSKGGQFRMGASIPSVSLAGE